MNTFSVAVVFMSSEINEDLVKKILATKNLYWFDMVLFKNNILEISKWGKNKLIKEHYEKLKIKAKKYDEYLRKDVFLRYCLIKDKLEKEHDENKKKLLRENLEAERLRVNKQLKEDRLADVHR